MSDTVKVTVLDTETGETKVNDEHSAFEWTDNNWSCDCNRELLFRPRDDDSKWGTCLGSKRYIVVAVEGSEQPLVEFNSDYPLDFL